MHNNDWYKKSELPPVGTECEVVLVGKRYRDKWKKCKVVFIGTSLIVLEHINGNQYAVQADECKFRPIQSERDKMVKQAIEVAGEAGAECDATFAGALIDAGWRPIKQQGEDEFVSKCLSVIALRKYDPCTQEAFCDLARAVYKADCRFIDMGDE